MPILGSSSALSRVTTDQILWEPAQGTSTYVLVFCSVSLYVWWPSRYEIELIGRKSRFEADRYPLVVTIFLPFTVSFPFFKVFLNQVSYGFRSQRVQAIKPKFHAFNRQMQ